MKDGKAHKMTSPAQFIRQVKQEVAKIAWPSRTDAMHGTFMVIVVSVLLAVFLFCVDSMFAWAIRKVIGG